MKHAILVSWLIVVSLVVFLIGVALESYLSENAAVWLNGSAAAVLIVSNIWAVIILRKVGKEQK